MRRNEQLFFQEVTALCRYYISEARSTLKAVAVLWLLPLFRCFKASYSFRSAVVTNAMVNDLHSAFLLSLFGAPQLSLDIAADGSLLGVKASVLGGAIK